MTLLAREIRIRHGRPDTPSMLMIDAQTVRGGRAGPTFHEAGGRGGRTIGTKRTILVEILGLPVAVRAESAKPHDVRAGRLLLRDLLKDQTTTFPRAPGHRRRPRLPRAGQPHRPSTSTSTWTSRLRRQELSASRPSAHCGGSRTPLPSSAAGDG
jgi:hypothetical protein